MSQPNHFTTKAVGIGRPLPHSLEAEEHLLSCCLLDGADVVPRCIAAHIGPESFYDPKHGTVYRQVLELYRQQKPIDVAVVAEELKALRQLDSVGGYAFLTQVSSRIPTTAQASYFIERVREQAVLREIIRTANGAVEDCYTYSGGIDEFIARTRLRLESAFLRSASGKSHEMPWADLLSFDPKADADCLMGNRYLGRAGAVVIVAQSGVGKSVLALQFAACAALGRPFFGLKIHAPLRVLYIQAEDDQGDVAETVKGFIEGYGLAEPAVVEMQARLRIVRWNDAAGDVFIERLRTEHRRRPFDLVVINPLFSFAGCNVSEQKELSPLLRNKLQPILNDTGAAAVVVHHTNKPPAKEDKGKDLEDELRYAGSGSAELTNWARAYIVLKRVPSAPGDVYAMNFAKRGKRAGIIDDEGRITTKVMIEHSKHGLCWMPSDYAPDRSGACQQRFSFLAAVKMYDPSRSWAENEARIAADQGLTPRAVRRYRERLETEGRRVETCSKLGLEAQEAA